MGWGQSSLARHFVHHPHKADGVRATQHQKARARAFDPTSLAFPRLRVGLVSTLRNPG